MPTSFKYQFDTPVYKGTSSYETGLFINGEFVDGATGKTIDVVNPYTGEVITSVSEGTAKDVDLAVEAAQKAYDTTWGLNTPGAQRAVVMWRIADLMEKYADELSALEALDNGKTFKWARKADIPFSINLMRYYAGWADKISGQTLEGSNEMFAYTRHEPIGVVGQIIPWNVPLLMLIFKIAPALATGNTVVIKPSELTPLTATRMCTIFKEANLPAGVVNVVTGYGNTVGEAISSHMKIGKVAFTGSTAVGRKILEAAAKSNLKPVTLELGGKSPNIIFNDADLDEAIKWSAHGLLWNHGQTCCAGTRIFVQSKIYDEFLEKYTAALSNVRIGDPFGEDVDQGPQISKAQFERIMGYIQSGKADGAKVHLGGERHGTEGYFVKPTIFTETTPHMRIVQDEIFGPVGVIVKFEDEDDVVRQANNTTYGLAAGVFSRDLTRAARTAHRINAGTVWVNCYNTFDSAVPFGGYKQSGIGRELGVYALAK